jgi:hypothetical protein
VSQVQTNPLGQTFDQAVADSEAWLRQADQLLATALYLAPKANVPTNRSHEASVLAVGSLKVTLLLLALSVENSLKAIKASRGQLVVEAGKVRRGSLGGGPSSHALQVLAFEVGLDLVPDEEELLEKLSVASLWAGKYQHPLTEAAFLSAVQTEPRVLRMPHDLDLTHKFLRRVHEVLGSSRC